MQGTFYIFRPRIEKGSWVVYFLLPFFLFMSFSFYEPWVNTAHVNDILTQRAMNNAFEFTFMPELDPSQHPFSPSYFSAWFPLLHPSSQSLPPCFFLPAPLFTIHPHQNSTSFLPSVPLPPFLLFFLLSPPPTPPSDSREATVQDQTLVFRTEHLLYHCFSSRSYSGGCSLIHFYNHEIRNWDTDTGKIFLQKLLSNKKIVTALLIDLQRINELK